VKAVASLGVNDAVRMVDPLAAGNQLHFATKGVTSAVASASHPLITTPAAENLILPCALAVPEITAGSRPNTAFPPESTNVGVVAAKAGTVLINAPPISIVVPIAMLEINRFISTPFLT
jgi:hypothetical protein